MTQHSNYLFLAQLTRCRPYIRYLSRTDHDADDAFQDLYLAAVHGSASRDWARNQAGWVRIVARNLVVRAQRRTSVRRCKPLDTEVPNSATDTPITAIQNRETQTIVREVVRSLTPNSRQVIERRFYAGESFRDIAHNLGVPEQTVRTRYKRAIKQLKEHPRLAALR
jgi:RNA polymerase sigma-70 factor (ECF subfamily)